MLVLDIFNSFNFNYLLYILKYFIDISFFFLFHLFHLFRFYINFKVEYYFFVENEN